MANPVQYMIDESGKKTSVLVPLKTWEKLQYDYSRMQHKLKVLISVKEGLEEIRYAQKNGKRMQTLKDFLRESNR